MAITFTLTEVVKTKDNYHFITWDASFDGGEAVDDYNFQIFWSNDPKSGFIAATDQLGDPITIDGAIGPLEFTHQRKHFDFNKDYYYRIKAIRKSDSVETFSDPPVFYNMRFGGIHDTIRHAEAVLNRNYDGEPCFIVKRKSWGTHCPECWSPELRQLTESHCDVCLGTGFVTGYYQKCEIQVSFDSDPKKSDSQSSWENVFDTKRGRLSNFPIVRPKDLIINKDDYKRYRITHVETTKLPNLSTSGGLLSKQNYIISQLITIEELVTSDVEYSIDIDGIPVIPESEDPGPGPTPPTPHPPVTTVKPLTIDSNQFLQLLYDQNKFEIIQTTNELTLTEPLCSLALELIDTAEDINTPFKVVISNGSGGILIADHTDLSNMNRVIGISISTGTTGSGIFVHKEGKITESSWSWTLGKSIFFDANGELTQTPQPTGFFMIIGRPLTSKSIEVEMESPVKRA